MSMIYENDNLFTLNKYRWNQAALNEWKNLVETMDAQKLEWETFLKTGRITSNSAIAPSVYSSWLRCRDRGLDPYDDSLIILPQHEIETRIELNSRLIEIVRPILHETAEYVYDSGYQVDLYDSDLYLLKRFGKPIHEGDYERVKGFPGMSRRESDNGTTAVSLAAILERPVQLSSYEHYKVCYHHLTSSAIPIMRNRKLLSVIGVTGNNWPMHKHTLALLSAIKYSIEYRISKGETRPDFMLPNRLNQELIEILEESTVVVDRAGKIIMGNKRAEEIMNKGWPSVIGFSAESVWGKRTLIGEVLDSKKTIINRETIMNIAGKPVRLQGTVKPLIDEKGGLQGAIGVFKELDASSDKRRKDPRIIAHYTFENIIGESPEIRQTIRLAEETAEMNNNILMLGESGTGKELFAQSIHNASLYKMGPFVAVNCSAIPHGLLESELFGYEGGAFTGAKKEGSIGKFELAANGTIFLDEINSMYLDMQAKILRVIQNRTIMRVGGTGEVPVNVRIVAASNVDLWELVKKGEFREDLYYRINVISIYIPPLRERTGDVELLINFFSIQLADQFKMKICIDEQAMEMLKQYPWPGNVRELENVLERSFVWAKARGTDRITAENIRSYRGIQEFFDHQTDKHVTVRPAEQRQIEEKISLDAMERELIAKTLLQNDGNIMATAQQLGIARNTLYRRMKRFGIENR